MVAVCNHSFSLQGMDDRVPHGHPHGQDVASVLSNLGREERRPGAHSERFGVLRSRELWKVLIEGGPFEDTLFRSSHLVLDWSRSKTSDDS